MTIDHIPLQSIQPPQFNPRSVIEGQGLEGLAASIRQDGLIQNLVVSRGKGQRYRIVSGERRYRALKLLEERGEIAGDYAVKVEIRKLSKEEALRLATVENVQRENLPPLDEAAAFAALIRKGTTLDDLAAKTGLSPTTIRRRLVLNDLCEEAKAALSAGEIGLAQAEAMTLGGIDAQLGILAEIERGYDDVSAAWGTPLGQDCIDLHLTLARWLGERLVFLADHTTTIKPDAEEPWDVSLRRNGEVLLRYPEKWNAGDLDYGLDEAKRALEWVAKNLHSLGD
jgi:ParB/RepB/Spo0J family partition protein